MDRLLYIRCEAWVPQRGHFDLRIQSTDHVEIIRPALEIGTPKGGLRTLTGVEKAPVLAIDVEMTEIATGCGLPHGQLQIAVELVSHECTTRIVAQAPRVVAECT